MKLDLNLARRRIKRRASTSMKARKEKSKKVSKVGKLVTVDKVKAGALKNFIVSVCNGNVSSHIS